MCQDLDELTETVSDYVKFCKELIIPKKCIHIFPNNKPWVSKSLINVINQRNICFNQGDETQYRVLQKQVKREITLAKRNYKDKIEGMLTAGNSRPAWEGVKSMMGLQTKRHPVSYYDKSDAELSNDLNSFYNHFNVHDFREELAGFTSAAPK